MWQAIFEKKRAEKKGNFKILVGKTVFSKKEPKKYFKNITYAYLLKNCIVLIKIHELYKIGLV